MSRDNRGVIAVRLNPKHQIENDGLAFFWQSVNDEVGRTGCTEGEAKRRVLTRALLALGGLQLPSDTSPRVIIREGIDAAIVEDIQAQLKALNAAIANGLPTGSNYQMNDDDFDNEFNPVETIPMLNGFETVSFDDE